MSWINYRNKLNRRNEIKVNTEDEEEAEVEAIIMVKKLMKNRNRENLVKESTIADLITKTREEATEAEETEATEVEVEEITIRIKPREATKIREKNMIRGIPMKTIEITATSEVEAEEKANEDGEITDDEKALLDTLDKYVNSDNITGLLSEYLDMFV